MEPRDGDKPGRAGGFDRVSAAMALATAVALTVAAWWSFRPEPIGEPPRVGSVAPPLGLIDAATGQPTLVLAQRGRVLWVTFWGSRGSVAAAEAAQLDRIWRRFRARRPFALIATTLDDADAARIRQALAATAPELPVYVATAATRRDFGVADPPLHFLIDDDGRIAAIVRGDGDNLERMADQAETLMDAIDPPGGRFAAVGPGRFAGTSRRGQL